MMQDAETTLMLMLITFTGYLTRGKILPKNRMSLVSVENEQTFSGNRAVGWCVHEWTDLKQFWFKCCWVEVKWEITSLWWKYRPPFKVNYEPLNAFQNLWLASATIQNSLQHQKHTLTHPKSKSTEEEAYFLRHKRPYRQQTPEKKNPAHTQKHEPEMHFSPPWSSKYSSSKFDSSCFCLLLSSFISFSCILRAMAYKQTRPQ